MYKPFHTKGEMNTPQAEGKVNSHLYSRGCISNKPFRCPVILDYMKNVTWEKKVQQSSAIKQTKLNIYLRSLLLISMIVLNDWIIEGQQQRHWLIEWDNIHKGHVFLFNNCRFV